MNPYEPPKSHVADPATEDTGLLRPFQVVLTIRLGVGGLLVGLFALLISWDYYSALGNATAILTNQVLSVILIVWIYYKIYVGRNWARVLYLVLVIAGLLIYINGAARGAMLAAPPIARISSVLNLALNIAVIWLVFTRPGGAWFKKTRRAPAA